MSKNILVLIVLLFSVNSFAEGEAVTQVCLDRLAANAETVKASATAVIRGQNLSEIKTSKTVPVDVQVFNDALYLLASLNHLTEPQEIEARQSVVMTAVCGLESFDENSIQTVLESLPVEQ